MALWLLVCSVACSTTSDATGATTESSDTPTHSSDTDSSYSSRSMSQPTEPSEEDVTSNEGSLESSVSDEIELADTIFAHAVCNESLDHAAAEEVTHSSVEDSLLYIRKQQTADPSSRIVHLPYTMDLRVRRMYDSVQYGRPLRKRDVFIFMEAYNTAPCLFERHHNIKATSNFMAWLRLYLGEKLSVDVLLHFETPFMRGHGLETVCQIVPATNRELLLKLMAKVRPCDLDVVMEHAVRNRWRDIFSILVETHIATVKMELVVYKLLRFHHVSIVSQFLDDADLTRLQWQSAVSIAGMVYRAKDSSTATELVRIAFANAGVADLPTLVRRTGKVGVDIVQEHPFVAKYDASWIYAVLLFEHDRRLVYARSRSYRRRIKRALDNILLLHRVHPLISIVAARVHKRPAIAFFMQNRFVQRHDFVKDLYVLDLETTKGIVDDLVWADDTFRGTKLYTWNMELLKQVALGTTQSTEQARDHMEMVALGVAFA